MCKRSVSLVCFVLVLGLAGGALGADPNLMGLWQCDEGTGTMAADSSGHGNDGTFNGDPQWVVGHFGGALEFDGTDDSLNCGSDSSLDLTKWTIVFWLNLNENKNYNGFVIKGADAAENYEILGFGDGSFHMPITLDTGRTFLNSPTGILVAGEWAHFAYSYDTAAGRRLYKDGSLVFEDTQSGTPQASTTLLTIGNEGGLSRFTNGVMDDIAIFNYAMTVEEIQVTMQGFTPAELAANPVPENEGVDVPRDTDLTWAPGKSAATHNAYFGDSFQDVNDATVPTASDLNITSFDPGRFEFGQTYFWRVDEVNGTPDKTVFKGQIWSFTAEPYSIQIPGSTIAVTASSASNEFSQPEKTIDGSGLGADESHVMGPETMWFTASVDLDPWIQYEFDTVRKLDIMKVWNSNSSAESAIGWGVKDVQIEYSVDGENWDVLESANQFSRAPGSPTYNQPDEIAFGGVAAKQVRLNIQSNWGGILMSYGLSEVQFYMIPAAARTPEPISGSAEVLPNAVVQWRAGRDVAQHTIYVSKDANAVTDGSTPSVASSTNSLDLTSLDLELGATYYWRVDEVNEAEATSVWAGPVWSFSTMAALAVDDFDRYNNISPNRPFQTWLDGFGYSADEFFPAGYGGNGTGAGIGHDIWSLSSPYYDGDIMETGNTLPGSGRSMPFYYTNTGGVASQTERSFAAPQDWTIGGAKTLSIAFFGQADNTGTLYVKINNTKIIYPYDAANIAKDAWQAWNIDLSSMNVQSVTTLQIGVDGASASGMILIDDIKLYPEAGEIITPAAPSNDNLVGAWSFDEGSGTVASDSSGHGYDGTIVNCAWEAGPAGSALVFDGLSSQVRLPAAAWSTINQQVTVSVWMYVDSAVTQSPVTFAAYQDPANGQSRVISTHVIWSDGNLYFDAGGDGTNYDRINKVASADVYGDAWVHWAFTKNVETGEQKVYRNGILWLSGSGLVRPMTGVTTFTLGAHNDTAFWNGSMDEFQLYNKELTQEEILWLAGAKTPMDKPF